MSSAPPPPLDPPTDYLDSAGGDGMPPQPRRRSGGGRRTVVRGVVAAGAVVALGAAGYGAWAAYSFFQTGSQPAEALPASTLGYVSVDLDPSGGQKIAALRTLNKFPAFKDKVGISSTDDLRKEIFDAVQGSGGCQGVDYNQDVKPWLGNRAAVAAVDTGASEPVPVVVVQVTDDDQAERGLAALRGCGGDSAKLAWHVNGDWALLAQTQATADEVAKEAASHSLADDGDFKHWTGETGDAGVLSMYAAPSAGAYLADHLDQLASFPMGLASSQMPTAYSSTAPGTTDQGSYAPLGGSGQVPGALKSQLRDFKGAAATIRFHDGGLELSVASDSKISQGALTAGGGSGGKLVESLPADTGAALGLGFQDGWLKALLAQMSSYSGQSSSDLESMVQQATGLTLPDDVETLTGHAAALSVGPGLDPSALFGGDPSTIPVALKIQGDPDAIQAVLAKVTAKLAGAGLPDQLLGSATSGDTVAVGPDAAYRSEVAEDGALGDSSAFQDVVPDADRASSVMFVDFDSFDGLVQKMSGGDSALAENLKPLAALGLAGWVDGDTSHVVLRVSTH